MATTTTKTATTKTATTKTATTKTATKQMATKQTATKQPSRHSALTAAQRDELAAKDFAFPDQRKEPLVDASHVRNAISRFDQVEGVTDAERSRAWKRILAPAERFDVEVSEGGWRELFR